ncbi:deuterolysin M35 metalloprotease [Collybia nuda]|uniref:Deuterolysin M35 metalloprotease n=1 Tax=Collybia nuda TaxID=64659 RepID=A0A9P5Y112_9AGAR|nr:deuterolysin M35 metalloprotease [Collybia nuda]
MFYIYFSSSAIHAALATLMLQGVAVLAVPKLSVSVSGPNIIADVKDLLLKVTVTNTGDQALRLIKDPQVPLLTSPTNRFMITGPNGTNPAFIGFYTKYAGVDWVAANGQSDAFTTLSAGQSISLTHNLSKAYDFANSGVGKYIFEAVNLFHYVDGTKRAISIKADSKSHQMMLEGSLSLVNGDSGIGAQATFVGCSASQQNVINAVATAAKTYVFNAISYLEAHTVPTPRFITWFGAFQTTRYNAVLSNFNSLTTRGYEFTGWEYDCTQVACNPGDYAIVVPNDYGVVYLCSLFWTAPLTGKNSQAGTLVHEGTHFLATAGTKDFALGQPACQALALANPNQAVNNADSYEYFAENTPPLA